MKKLTLTACLLASLSAFAVLVVSPSGDMQLGWNYPTNGITPDLKFFVTATNDLSAPLTNWPVVWSGSYSNSMLPNGYDGNGNFTNIISVHIQPGQMFFTAYASNFWGVTSQPSNTASTPMLASQIYMGINRTN